MRSETPVMRRGCLSGCLMRANNSLQLTRLACGKLERVLPAKWRENGCSDA
jgi:hypothetical protein